MGTSQRVSPDQVISTFYDAALDPALWQSELTQFASLMDSQGSILMLADKGRWRSLLFMKREDLAPA